MKLLYSGCIRLILLPILILVFTARLHAQTTTAGYAVKLDGFDDYISIPAGQINLANSSFTIEFWAKRDRAGAGEFIIGQGSGDLNRFLHIGFRENNAFSFNFWGNDLATPNTYSDLNWHHWACTYNASTRARTIYRDGVVVGSDTASANFQGTGEFHIGQAFGYFFKGTVEDVRIWNIVRSQSEIQSMMSYPLPFALTGIVSIHQFNQGSGLVSEDSTNFDRDGTLMNGTTWVASGAPLRVSSRLIITTSPQTTVAGALSGTITVQRQHQSFFGGSWIANTSDPDLVVNLSSSSTAGVFRNTADTANIFSVTIPFGQSSVSFRYKDTIAGAPVITASASGLTSAQQTETVDGGAATRLLLQGVSTNQTAGSSQTFAVTVKDAFNNTANRFSGVVVFDSSDPQATLPSNYIFVPEDAGNHTFITTLRSAGTHFVRVSSDGVIGAMQSGIAVTPAAAATLNVSAYPASTVAGIAQDFTVAVGDSFGNRATNFVGTVSFSSSDSAALLPSSYTFVAGDQGVHTFNSTFKTAGTQILTVSATGLPAGSQSGISVIPAAAASLVVEGYPTSQIAGLANSFNVTVRDSFNNIATNFVGTVSFSSSDSAALLPSSYTFVAGDQGVHTFNATFKTAGTQSLTALVTGLPAGSQTGISVIPAAAASLVVSGYPANRVAGTSGSFTVTAKDSFNNTATNFVGVIYFSSSDSAALLPSNYTFVSGDRGVHTFNATFKMAGTQSLTASATNLISVSQTGISVSPSAAASLIVAGYPNLQIAGVTNSFTVTAKDSFNNTATNFVGVVSFSSSDSAAMLPSSYTFVGGDRGVRTFNAALRTVGTQSLTATATGLSVGSQTGISVSPAAAASLVLSGYPTSRVAGTAGSFTVAAKDSFNNVATNFTGTVTFSSSDSAAILPSNYTFAAGDGGVRIFSATLVTTGTQSLTASTAGATAGTQSGILITPFTAAVTTLDDSGPGSLRQALLDKNLVPGLGTIDLSALSGTIILQSPLPLVQKGVTILGPGAEQLTISGNNQYRVFFVDAPSATIQIQGITIANGYAKGGNGAGRAGGGAGLGGGLFVNQGHVTLTGVMFLGCSAVGGNGGNASGGGGGGGGLGGDGGNGSNGGGGGGGFYGRGGNASLGGGGGGGLYGNGGAGSNAGGGSGAGGGGGGLVAGANASGAVGGAGNGGGGAGANAASNTSTAGAPGSLNGGGGGGGRAFNLTSRGGDGGRFGGGGGGGNRHQAGFGGEFGGGGGQYDEDASGPLEGGHGGFGGGGGAGSVSKFYLPGGNGGFGGGGGAGPGSNNNNRRGLGGTFGGNGGYFQNRAASGGGGAALGGSAFVRANNGATLTWVDSGTDAGFVTAGLHGTGDLISSDGRPGDDGTASGSSLFLLGGSTTFTIRTETKTIPGSIGGWSGSPASIVKNGPGTLILSGTNTYPGATIITEGTLQVDGNIAASANAVAQNGGALSGNGTVGVVAVDNGGILSPGAGLGVLKAGNTTWTNAGHYRWQIQDAAGVAGVGYDLLNVTGTLDVSGADGFFIEVESLASTSPESNGDAFNFDSTKTNAWTLVKTTQGITGFDPAQFTVITSAANGSGGFSNPLNGGHFTVDKVGNDLILRFYPAVVISWAAPSAITYGTTLSGTQLSATASVPGTFIYTPPLGTLLNAGTNTLSLTFTPSDTVNYASATRAQSLIVSKASQIVTFDPLPDKSVGDAPIALLATASSGLPVSFSVVSGPAQLTGTTLTLTGSGTVLVRAAQGGNTNYLAATSVDRSFIVRANPVITWAHPSSIVYGTALSGTQLNAAASVPGTFSYTPALGVILSAGTNTLSVTFTPTDTTRYNSVTATRNLVVTKASQTITFATLANKSYGDAPFTLSATASSGLSVSFSVVSGPAQLSGNTLTLAGLGSVTVQASQAGDSNYSAAASVNRSFSVTKGNPVITWATPAAVEYGTALSGVQLNATASVPGSFSYTPASGAVLNAGTNILSATFTPTDSINYNVSTTNRSLVVNKADQAITFNTLPDKTYGDAPFALSATTTSGLSVSFSVVSGPAQLSGNTLTLTGAGTVTVRAAQSGNTNYLAATAIDRSFTVAKANAVITWATPTAIGYGTPLSAAQLNATASVPGTFTYTPALGAVLNSGTNVLSVTFTPTNGTNYNGATASQNLVINKASQTISFDALPNKTYGDTSFTLLATASSGLPVNFSVVSGPAQLTGSTLTLTGAGSVTVQAAQSGNTNYLAASSVDRSFIVAKATPAITWNPATNIYYGVALGSAQLNATSSVPGTFTYNPAAGTMLEPGTYTLSVTFVPTDSNNYASIVTTRSNIVVTTFSVAVTTLADSGAGSLRQAIIDQYATGGAGIIDLSGVAGTIVLQSPLPILEQSVTILGPGASQLTISGANAYRVFFVDAPGKTIQIQGVTIANGRAKGGSGGKGYSGGGGGLGAGGGIFVNAGDLKLTGVVFANNSAIGGNGGSSGSASGTVGSGSGGGGGFGGDGGQGGALAGGGGGGFSGKGGNTANPSSGGVSGSGGGGRTGNGAPGGSTSNQYYGGGGGGHSDAVAQAGGAGGGGRGGDDTQGAGNSTGGDGLPNGGGGGGGNGYLQGYNGGHGGKGGKFGGGGGSKFNGLGGTGGEFGGGGGSGDAGSVVGSSGLSTGGTGGFGGGGGGAGVNRSGAGGFGAGSGGARQIQNVAAAGAFGGSGGSTGAGGGGGALGGSVFVRVDNGASLTWTDSGTDSGTVTAGLSGGGNAAGGAVAGSSLFLPGGSTTFAVQSGTKSVSGSIGDWTNAPASIVKSGAGTLVFLDTSTYSGITTIANGILQVNGSIALSTNVIVQSGAILNGTGIVGQLTLTGGSVLSPGSSVGTLRAGNTILTGAGHYRWQVRDASGPAGIGYDLLDIAGTLDVSGADGFMIDIGTLSSVAPETSGSPANFDNTKNNSWTLVKTTQGVTGFDSAKFVITTSTNNGAGGFTQPLNGGQFKIEKVGNDLVLKFQVIDWPAPAPISYGTSLSINQLNASANIPGTYSYNPPSGTVLNAGTNVLSVTFTPQDQVHYTSLSATQTLVVLKVPATLTWPAPSGIVYGTPLSGVQLNADANGAAGTFSYNPAAGTILNVGTNQLTVTFTPADVLNYATATATQKIVVTKAVPVVTWNPPSQLFGGVALPAAFLNATANSTGTFTYSPVAGTVLPAGNQTLTVTFTPNNLTNYSPVTITRSVFVGSTTMTVNELSDSGPGSLREALTAKNATSQPGTIDMSALSGTIVLQSPLPLIEQSVTILGPGSGQLTISGDNKYRVFFVDAPGQTVEIRGVTLANGRAKGGNGSVSGGGGLGAGGAIFVNAGNVNLNGLSFTNNVAVGGNGGVPIAGLKDGGGGGGLGGDGGKGQLDGGGGGGGFGGKGGSGSSSGYGGGGGGGRIGNGANGVGSGGGGGGGLENAIGQTGGAGGGGNGGPSGLDITSIGGDGTTNGGGGGGGYGKRPNGIFGGNGGAGGKFGGGGGNSIWGNAGRGGEFGGGGGAGYVMDLYIDPNGGNAGDGGFGGGGGGGSVAWSGKGGFGGGGGGTRQPNQRGAAGAFGGLGGYDWEFIQRPGGGGGALGGAVFVRADNGASLIWTDSESDAGSVIPGVGGGGIQSQKAQDGSGAGSSLFLLGGSTAFAVQSGTKSISGSIGGWTGSPAGIVKSGAGSLVLSGTNTYSGTTTVTAGTLQVDGSIAASANTIVGSGAQLTGSGVVGSLSLASSSVLSPGSTVGSLRAGNTTWTGTGQYLWQISDAEGITGAGADLLDIAGTLDVSAASGLVVRISSLSSTNPAISGSALNFDNTKPYSWTIVRTTAGIVGFSASKFSIVANVSNGFMNPLAGGHFSIAQVGNNLVLRFHPVVVLSWASPSSVAYGTLLSSVQLNATANVPGTFIYNPSAGALLNAGSNLLKVTFNPTDSVNYAQTTLTQSLVVSKAGQTIVFASLPDKTFDDTPFILSATASSGALVSFSVVSGPAQVVEQTLTLTGAGTVTIRASQAGNANYLPADPVDVSFVVRKGTPSITWPAPSSIVYGTALSATQLNASASVPGTFNYSPSAGAALNAGTHTLHVTFVPTDTVNYNSATSTQSLNVGRASQTITFAELTRKTFGDGPAILSAAASSGLAVSFSVVSGPAQVSGSTLTVTGAGTVVVRAAQEGNTNYVAAAAVDRSFTVAKGAPAISWNVPANVVYGTALSETQLNATADVPGTFAYSPATGEVLEAGTNTLSVIFTPTETTNYETASASVELIVEKAPLTITAINQSRKYGASNPELTAEYSGFVNGDTSASLDSQATLSTIATAASVVGNYSITVAGAVDANYDITFLEGTLSVNPADLVIRADDKTKMYGAAIPEFTATYDGFVNGDTPDNLDVPVALATSASASSHVGPYTILATGAMDANYNISLMSGTLTVTPANLIIRAVDKSKVYGEPLPEFTATYDGFVAGDTPLDLDIPVTLATSATMSSNVGTYSIVTGGAADADYTITFSNGNLTITQANLLIAAENKSQVYGSAMPELTAVYMGLVNGDTEADLDVPATLTTVATTASPVGSYPIQARGAADINYAIVYQDGALNVAAAALVITADFKERMYGEPNPELTVTYSGFVNGDTPASLDVPVSLRATADQSSNFGFYSIVPSDAADANYSITFVDGWLVVTNAPLTLRANNASRAYGQENPVLEVTVVGIKNNDRITAEGVTQATARSPVGQYPITVSLRDPDSKLDNYNFATTMEDGMLTIDRAPLLIQTDNVTKVYGESNPELTGAILGIMNGDNISVSRSTTATEISPVGDYEITSTLVDPDNKSGNYEITPQIGTLTVTKASLIIMANDTSRNFGTPNPEFTATIAGFVNGESISALSGAPAFTTTATSSSLPGTYPITPSAGTLSSQNYEFAAFLDGTITVLNTPPSAQSQSITIAEDSSRVITLTGVDPEGGLLMFELKTPPSHGDLVGGPPNPTYIPHPNYYGSDNFVITAHDGQFESEPATITINVSPVEDAPTISAIGAQTMSQNSSLHLIFSVGDVDTALADLTVTAESSNTALVPNSSAGLQLSGSSATRTIEITPALGQTGTTIITLSVSDGTSSYSTSFDLTVSEENGSEFFAGTALEGYIANGTVFFDANRNGIQDGNEPGTQTDSQGHFNLKVDIASFDRNENGQLDTAEGRLVLKGGTDIATGLPLKSVMTAPLGATVVTPSTTVLEELQDQNPALSGTQAEQLLMTALGVPNAASGGISLLRYDPFDAALANDSKAPVILNAAAKIFDTIVQTSALLETAATQPAEQIGAMLNKLAAAQILAAGQLDLSSANEVKVLITQGASELNVVIPTDVVNGAAVVMSEVNQAKDEAIQTGLTPLEAIAEVTRVQHVAQSEVASELALVGAGDVSIDDVVLSHFAQNLIASIQAAPVGNLTGFDTRPGIISFSRSQFQVHEGGASIQQVTLNREHGTRGELTALVTLADGEATAAAGDYTPGIIAIHFADGEISKSVDLSNHIGMDGQVEGDETIRLSVTLKDGAPAGSAVGYQSRATLTVVDADSAGRFAFLQSGFEIRENGTEPNSVTIARTGGTSGAVTVVVTPTAMGGGATPGADYVAEPISVTFGAGAQYRRVAIPVVRDSENEPNEQLRLALSLDANSPASATLGEQAAATVTILDVPNTMPLATPRTVAVQEEGDLNLTLSGQDNEGDSLTFYIMNSPSHGVLSGTPPNLTYRPNLNFNGSDSFTFKSKDGLLDSAPATILIEVIAVNDGPVLNKPILNQDATYGSDFTFTVPADAFSDVDVGQVLSYSASGLPPGVVFNEASRTLSGKPALAGQFTITITASDNGVPALSTTGSFEVSVAKALLTVSANDAARDYGRENPQLNGTLLGVVNNDQIIATYSTTAGPTSPVGAYPIVPGVFEVDGKLVNYIVSKNNGTLTVRNLSPLVDAGPDQEVFAGEEVTFAGSFTDPSSSSHVAGWDFGDGTPPVAGTLTPKHVFAKHGIYTVQLMVIDSHGASAIDTLVVSVISSQGLIRDALTKLSPYGSEPAKIQKIIKDLNASLENKFWLDEMHLNPQNGSKAFINWRQAVDMSESLLKPSNKRSVDARDATDGEDDDEFKTIFNKPAPAGLSTGAINALQHTSANVVGAAMLMSETVYLESHGLIALDPRKQKRVDAALKEAKNYLDRAAAASASGELGKAIREYLRSWNNTQDAIAIAGQSQPVKELAKAQELIEASLDPQNWLDDLHLVLATGEKTFNLMQNATRNLVNVIGDAQKGRVIGSVGQAAKEELMRLLKRGGDTARLYYLENQHITAVKPANQKSVQSDLTKAIEDLNQASAAELAGDYDKAMNGYASSWARVASALNQAAKTK